MKVFWAWQSDTPGKIGRHFVRDALLAAIAQLKSEIEVVEPIEREALEAMDLDHDRKGVPGSPDLARTILEKIEAAAVFVADVTPVGIVPLPDDSSKRPKRLINSNVAIELGYALRNLGDRSLLMVMNTHYGDRTDLPFDVAHKGGPLMYDLAPGADNGTIASTTKRLQVDLVKALKLCLQDHVSEAKAQIPFEAAQPKWKRALYFPRGETLAQTGQSGEFRFSFMHDHVLYLRIHPVGGATQVGRAKVAQIFDERRPMTLSISTNGGITTKNEFGSLVFEVDGDTAIRALTQGFKTGELWGINADLFQPYKLKRQGEDSDKLDTILPCVTFEKVFCRVLKNYVKVEATFGLQPPYVVTFGATGLRNIYISVPTGGPFGNGSFHGPIPENDVERTYTLASDDDATVYDVLRRFFGEIYDLAAISREDAWTDQLTAAHDVPSR